MLGHKVKLEEDFLFGLSRHKSTSRELCAQELEQQIETPRNKLKS